MTQSAASNSPELQQSGRSAHDRSQTSDTGATVLIESRSLVRDCIALSMATFDPTTRFEAYPDAATWASQGQPAETVLVLFCCAALSGDDFAETMQPAIAAAQGIVPGICFAIMAAHHDATQASEAIRLGARGYLSPEASLEVTIHALKLIRAGGIYVPASLLGAARPLNGAHLPDTALRSLFSPRELEVAGTLRKGLPNKVIALELGMSESTVKVHVRNIIKKLKVKNRTEVAFRTQGLFLDEGS